MPQASGSKARLIYQLETNFKQIPSTANATVLPFKSESFRSSQNLISSETIRATRDSARPVLGNIAVEGSVSIELQANIGTLFRCALGSVTTSEIGQTGAYQHVFKVDTLPSLFIEKGFTDLGKYFQYLGCKVNRMSITVNPEGFQEVSFDFLGAKEDISNTTFDSNATTVSFAPFMGFEVELEEGGVVASNILSVEVTLENNLDGSIYVLGGQGYRQALPEGRVKVSGRIVALFDNSGYTLFQKAKNNQTTSIKIKFKRGNGNGTAGNEYLEIYMPEVILAPQAPVVEGPAGIKLDLPYEAFYDTGQEGSSMVVILKNTQSQV